MSCIPESVYMFLKVLYGGQSVLEDDQENVDDECDVACVTDDRIIAVAQDIVYEASNGRMWTPKHVGLGSTLHQATRSKLFSAAFSQSRTHN